MRIAFFCFLLFLCSNLIYGQENIVRQQAEQMGAALIRKDYAAFTAFTYPSIMKDMGGKEKMTGTIRSQMESIEQGGARITALSYGTPAAIIKEKKELQCTLPQIMTMQVPGGKIIAKTTLIAISLDDGNRWYFVDAGERSLEAVRTTLPNLSKKLSLPAPEQPQLIRE